MTTKRPKPKASAAEQLAEFLIEYAGLLLSSGATTLRTERNILRMAEFYSARVDITILPRHIELVVTQDSDQAICMREGGNDIDFYRITALSLLSWQVVEKHLTIENAIRCLRHIAVKKRIPTGIVALAAGVANASFCRLFQGDWWAMLFVFIATVGGFYCKYHMISQLHFDRRIATIIAACLSTIISCGPHIFGFGFTAEVAVATSVLYLVPGVPFLNAFSDLIDGHYICSMNRFLSAMETTVCLGVGLVFGNYLLNL